MKQFLSMIFAGMIGALITMGVFFQLKPETYVSDVATTYAQEINYKNLNTKPSAAPLDFKAAARRAMPAVVHISAKAGKSEASEGSGNPLFDFFGGGGFGDFGPKQGTGSGVIYTKDGYIITNNHVVEFADEVTVTLNDNREFAAEIIGRDDKTDLAVLKIEGSNFPTLEIGNSDAAEVGEWVLAVGNPFDLTSTVTAGIISAKGRSINILGGGNSIESFIQTDAAVNPGNSGGALVDDEGRLIGINTAIASRTGSYAGYSFAIPVNLMERIIEDIIDYGSFQRAYLGVGISELDSEYANELNVKVTQGVVIESLADDGSAKFAGLMPKDVIVSIDGKMVKSVPELQEVIGRAKAGETVVVTVIRGEEGQMDIPVTLKAG
ncbi:MAG: S1C family serine protease [Saprospiraceae bacterium]